MYAPRIFTQPSHRTTPASGASPRPPHPANEQYMNEGEGDAYFQFTRAAHIVESGAKVWAHRVENTHLMTSQVYRRLMRMDNKDDVEEAEAGADKENQEGSRSASNVSDGTEGGNANKRKTERTLADTNDELCVKASDEKHFNFV